MSASKAMASTASTEAAHSSSAGNAMASTEAGEEASALGKCSQLIKYQEEKVLTCHHRVNSRAALAGKLLKAIRTRRTGLATVFPVEAAIMSTSLMSPFVFLVGQLLAKIEQKTI